MKDAASRQLRALAIHRVMMARADNPLFLMLVKYGYATMKRRPKVAWEPEKADFRISEYGLRSSRPWEIAA